MFHLSFARQHSRRCVSRQVSVETSTLLHCHRGFQKHEGFTSQLGLVPFRRKNLKQALGGFRATPSTCTTSRPSSNFGEDCTKVDIFEARAKEIVACIIRGFIGTVFGYGQTGSGKTDTVRGSEKEPGIILLSVDELFCGIQEEMNREFLVRMSCMNIYNEEMNDLLATEHQKLQIHESLERGIYAAGLKEETVTSPEQVLELVEFGESHRHIGKTNMNLYSSRSHTIFRMIIESQERSKVGDSANFYDAVLISALNFMDLAGSERAVKTGAKCMRLKEGSHINISLLTLGIVIKKLSDGADRQGGNVPDRDSKLTRILQPAFGGNAYTAITCNINLSQIHADETSSSLLFASRALQVKNCACVNEILTDAAPLKHRKKAIEELRAKFHSSQSELLEEEILNLRNTQLQMEAGISSLKEALEIATDEKEDADAKKEELILELTEALLDAEIEKSDLVLKEKRPSEELNISNNEIVRLLDILSEFQDAYHKHDECSELMRKLRSTRAELVASRRFG